MRGLVSRTYAEINEFICTLQAKPCGQAAPLVCIPSKGPLCGCETCIILRLGNFSMNKQHTWPAGGDVSAVVGVAVCRVIHGAQEQRPSLQRILRSARPVAPPGVVCHPRADWHRLSPAIRSGDSAQADIRSYDVVEAAAPIHVRIMPGVPL